jgi:uncharacterized cupredoxin-like copper-binding protein
MKLRSGDREVFGAGAMIFGFLALVVATGALVAAGAAYSRSNDANDKVAKMIAGGLLGRSVNVDLQEFSIKLATTQVKAGKVRFDVTNRGSIGHEMVVARAASASVLPLVTTAGDREVGAVDEEAIAAPDTMGEVGELKPGAQTKHTIELSPGTYVLYCNIDTKTASGVINHFHKGMTATLTVV